MEKPKNNDPQSSPKPKEPSTLDHALRYSGLGMQLLVTIGAFVWLGLWLDKKINNGRPLWVLILLFVGTAGAFYQLIKSLPKN